MKTDGPQFLAYLDQNIYSRLQHDCKDRAYFERLLEKLAEFGAIFVFSDIDVEECRSSERATEFAQIFDDLGAHYLRVDKLNSAPTVLELGRAKDLILAPHDFTDVFLRRIEDILKPMHWALGWLGEIEAEDLLGEMAADLEATWPEIESKRYADPFLPFLS